MKCSDGQKIVMSVVYDGKNMGEVVEMVKEHSIRSLACVDKNDIEEWYLLSANPYGEAMEEYPTPGDVYVVDTETKEIYIFTDGEFNARYKEVEL